MNIFLDNNVFSIQTAGGVSVYWYELVRRLCRQPELDVTFLNAHQHTHNILEKDLDYTARRCLRESSLPQGILRYLPLQCRLPTPSIFHSGYMRTTPQPGVLNILTVHDFSHERRLASTWPRSEANIRLKARGIARADGIICVSNNTRRDLLHFYPRTDPEKVRVILHGIGDTFHPEVSGDLPPSIRKPYLLYVGGRRHYKQFHLAVKAMQYLKPSLKLVIAGGEPMTRAEGRLLEDMIPNRYTFLGTVSGPLMNRLYQQAFCLVYPSAYEGFGFPPGEAMRAACPVVASASASIPEVVGDAALLVRQLDAVHFADQIRSLEEPRLRSEMIRKGLIRGRFLDWDRCSRETLDFYRFCWQQKYGPQNAA